MMILLIAGCLSPLAAQQINLTPEIYHTPVLKTPAHKAVSISLVVVQGTSRIVSCELLWRQPGGEFRTVEMESNTTGFAAIIPEADINPPYIEYAIFLQFDDGLQVSFPAINPLVSPQVTVVIPPQEVKSQGPEFVVLYPSDGAVVFDDQVSIAVSIFDPDSVYDPSSLQVMLDGRSIEVIEKTRTYIFARLDQLSPGSHRVKLKSADYSGQANSDFQWRFSTTTGEGEALLETFNWAFTGEASQEEFGDESEGVLRGDFRAKGEYKNQRYSVRTSVTSDEAWDRQPQNRYTFALEGANYHLTLGDSYPIMSDLVLSGKRVRGVEFGANYRRMYVSAVMGETYKAIENSAYRRYLYAVRPYYASPGGTRIGFSILKSKDDIGSISAASVSPQDNIVAGFDAALPFLNRKLELAFAAAISLTAQDITGGSLSKASLEGTDVELPFDPEPFEPIIVINESLNPPDPLKMGSLAWTTRMSLREFGHNLSLNYRNIGPSYISFGNPYLQNDVAGVNLSDQFSLWKRHVFVNLGLDRQWDNLKDSQSSTTATTGGWATFSIYPCAPAPTLILSLNYRKGGNDISMIDSAVSAGDTIWIDQRRDEETKSISASIMQGIRLFDRRHSLTFSLNHAEFNDLIDDRPSDFTVINSSSSNIGFLWKSHLTTDIEVTGNFAYYASESGYYQYKYNQAGCGFIGRYLNRQLQVSLNANRRFASEDLRRWHTGLRADWEFIPGHDARAEITRYFNDNSADEGIYRLYYFKRF